MSVYRTRWRRRPPLRRAWVGTLAPPVGPANQVILWRLIGLATLIVSLVTWL